MNLMVRISFYRRLQLSFLILILLPFAAMMFWSYTSVERNVSEKIARSNDETLQVISNQITRTIDSISYASVYFSDSYDTGVLESLRGLQDAEAFKDYESYAHFTRLQTRGNVLSVQSIDADLQMFMVNRKERIIMGNLDQPAFTKPPERFLRESRGLDGKVTTVLQWFPYYEGETEPRYYFAARAIMDPRNLDRLATLFIGIPASYFHSLLDTGDLSGRMVLTDRSGELIAARQGSVQADSGDMLVSKALIPKVNWSLTSRIPRETVTGEINREFLVTLTVVSLFFSLFLVLSFLWAGWINKPISMLRSSVKQYVGGNRKVRIPIRGKDEVAVLSTAFNRMFDDIDELLRQVETEQEEKRRLEIQALVAQIRPHFLLNTLNSIKVNLIMAGDETHSGMIDSLMTLLRGYVRVEEPAELTEEIRLLNSYIQVMQVRNRLNIRFVSSVDEAAEKVRLPRLLLQPLIENAIIHGFAARPEEPVVELTAVLTGGGLEIAISDNGRGMSEDRLRELNRRLGGMTGEAETGGKGVGLVNTARRLHIYYGPRARLTGVRRPEGGLVFVLFIPTGGSEEDSHAYGNAD